MSEDEGRRWLAAYREALDPSAVDRVRVRAAIDRRSPPRSNAGGMRIAVIALAVAAVVMLALSLADAGRLDERDDRPHRNAAPDTIVAPEHAPIEQAPARAPAIAPSPSPPRAEPAAPTPTPRRAPEPAPIAVPDENALLERALRALDAKHYDAVLAIVAEHHRTFPRGTLTVEARALRVLALCESDRLRQGRGEATTFLQAHARAPYRERIAHACGIEP